MNFADIILQNATTPMQEHELTDGRHQCAYRDIPEWLDAISNYLRTQGLGEGVVPALECINSTASALTLLALLRKGQSFLLSPGNGTDATTLESKPIPHFCKYRIIVRRAGAANNNEPWLEAPERFLAITENTNYLGISDELSVAGKLYLRTSGSMGAAKIVVHDHAKLSNNAHNCVERFGLRATDRVTLPVPIFHMYGLGAGFLPTLTVGASIHLEDHSNILRYLESERRFHPSVAFLNPLLCDMLLRGRRSGDGYRRVVTATQRIRKDTFRAFDARVGNLVSLYGSTEMGAVAACHAEDPLDLRATTLGLPMRGVQLRLETADSAGSELLCRHPYGFEGYLDDHGHWLLRTTEDDWYHTGDLATHVPQEGIMILGRANLSVNRSGYLVQLDEIEQIMGQFPGLEQVVLLADGEEDQRGQRLTAFCTVRHHMAGNRLDESRIRSTCFEQLPKHAIPDRIHILNTLPLLPSGKVDRQSLLAYNSIPKS